MKVLYKTAPCSWPLLCSPLSTAAAPIRPPMRENGAQSFRDPAP